MVPCAVRWCVALARPDGQYCAPHAERGPSYRISDTPVSVECRECEGSGECHDCDGLGTHSCEHRHCWEEHECPTCDGSGECSACHPPAPKGKRPTFEERYLAFAFDPGWQPAVLVDWPWDEQVIQVDAEDRKRSDHPS